MADIKLGILNFMGSIDMEKKIELHHQRAKLVHGLVDSLDLEVKDWGATDASQPHEFVAVIIALGSAGVFAAIVEVVKAWLDKGKMEEVTIEGREGMKVTLRKATALDVHEIVQDIGLNLR